MLRESMVLLAEACRRENRNVTDLDISTRCVIHEVVPDASDTDLEATRRIMRRATGFQGGFG